MTTAEIKRHAAALSALQGDAPAWLAFKAWQAKLREDAIAQVKRNSLPSDQRAHWAGAIDALDDLMGDLEDLRNGAWKDWPGMHGRLANDETLEEREGNFPTGQVL